MFIKKSKPTVGAIRVKDSGLEITDSWQEIDTISADIDHRIRLGEVIVADIIPKEPEVMEDGKAAGEPPVKKGLKVRKLPGIGKIYLHNPTKTEITERWTVLDIVKPTLEMEMRQKVGEIEWVPYSIGDEINPVRKITPEPKEVMEKDVTVDVELPEKKAIIEETWPLKAVTPGEKAVRDIPGVGPAYANKLTDSKFKNVDDVAASDASTLAAILGCKESKAGAIITAAKEVK